MRPGKVEVKTFVQDINSTSKLCKSLTALFASTQILFGFNFGFVKQMKKLNMAAHLTSITMAFMIMACLVKGTSHLPSLSIYSIQYMLTLIILISSKYTLFEFISDMMNIRKSHNSVKNDYIATKTWVYLSIVFIFKLTMGILYHFYYIVIKMQGLYSTGFLSLVPILALDTIPIFIFLVFYHLYAKMRDLKQDFQSGEADLHEVRATYREVADLFDKIRPTTDTLMILGFMIDSPKWILTIWNQLMLHKSSQPWLILGCCYAFGLHLTIQMCVPAVVAEMVQAQTDAITLAIHERIIAETDDKTIEQCERLVRYIEARPLLRRAWRILPLGLRLPVIMLSTCMTYLIVIIQFSHLYD